MKLFKIISCVFVLALICSCSSGVDKAYEIKGLELTMEGPLFEGPNSASAVHKVNLGQLSSSADKVKGATLKSVVLYLPDSLTFDDFSDFKFQLTADDAAMTEAAQLNPVPAGSSRIELQVSSEAELADFFKLDEFIILIDGNLKEEIYDNFSFKADLVFDVKVSE
ncbi:MAG: hypothetical protein WED33_11325 [Bacteroidia bacterium]